MDSIDSTPIPPTAGAPRVLGSTFQKSNGKVWSPIQKLPKAAPSDKEVAAAVLATLRGGGKLGLDRTGAKMVNWARELESGTVTVAELTLDDLLPLSRGRRAAPTEVAYVRDLTVADIVRLLSSPEGSTTQAPLKKLRTSHHRVAKLVADGVREGEISLITGYSVSRISYFKTDPAFRELVAFYQEQKEELYVNLHERIAALGTDAMEELQTRLDENPAAFGNRDLKDLVEAMLDRAGYGPKSTVNHNFGSDTMDAMLDLIKEAAEAKQNGSITTIRPQGHNATPTGVSIGPEAELLLEYEAEGGEGEGEDL